jgi:alpha-galactosidase
MKQLYRRLVHPSVLAILLFAFFQVNLSPVHALNNGLARTPPMGWNPWNVFRDNINETLMKEMTDKFVSTGLANAGYKYMIIDNGWYESPNASVYKTSRFPNGIKALADYVHGKGLKLGLYTGWEAERNPTRDAAKWASWEIDYLKHDAWQTPSTDTIWAAMSKAILATKRPIVYSVHFSDRAKVIGNPNIVNMWRFTNDLIPYYDRSTVPANLSWGVTTVDILDTMARVAPTTGPGTWADADMLMVEQGNQTLDEWRTSFAISCILPSPLILSSDVRVSPKSIMDIFLNEELIAVNQDTSGYKTWKVRDDGAQEVWARKLSDSSLAVAFFNTSTTAKTIPVTWTELKEKNGSAKIRNLWAKQDVGIFSNTYSASVPAHGTAFLKVTPERFVTKIGETKSNRGNNFQADFSVRAFDGSIQLALNNQPATPLHLNCTITSLTGKRISSSQWSIQPGATNQITMKVPADIKNGLYIVSIKTENPTSSLKNEFQTKVFIKR